MYSEWVWQLIVGAVFVWNLALTFIVIRERGFLRKLFPENGQRDIRKKFEELLEQVTGFGSKLNNLSDKLTVLDKDSYSHIQKVKLIRYNPFDDVGGDQSFSIALLDNKGEGVVVTSLHNRSGTRVFAKPVTSGKLKQYEFSKEEESVVSEALKI